MPKVLYGETYARRSIPNSNIQIAFPAPKLAAAPWSAFKIVRIRSAATKRFYRYLRLKHFEFIAV
jgi:hypothetical protein